MKLDRVFNVWNFAKLMHYENIQTAPELYSEYVTKLNGVTTICVELIKVMYGPLLVEIIFHKKLLKTYLEMDFSQTNTNHVWSTKQSMINSVQSSGGLMI